MRGTTLTCLHNHYYQNKGLACFDVLSKNMRKFLSFLTGMWRSYLYSISLKSFWHDDNNNISRFTSLTWIFEVWAGPWMDFEGSWLDNFTGVWRCLESWYLQAMLHWLLLFLCKLIISSPNLVSFHFIDIWLIAVLCIVFLIKDL